MYLVPTHNTKRKILTKRAKRQAFKALVMVFPIVSQKNWDARKIIFPHNIYYAIFMITF
jgi:hypothetical protein